MVPRRFLTFWLLALALLVAGMMLLREILLPFVAGMMLAYVLNPTANWLERFRINRLVATLVIIAAFVVAIATVTMLIAPIVGAQLSALIENIPGYADRIHALLTDPSRPWLRRLFGEEQAQSSGGDLTRQAASWLGTFVKSLWSGGQALLSIFSLVVVTPVVGFYLLYDWNRMIATADGWVPLPYRHTVRQLGREIDQVIAGFIRGQAGVCLILGSFYAVGLTLVGLNFGLLIGLFSGLVSFVPYLGSLAGLVLSLGIAVAQFWPEWTPIVTVAVIFFVGQFLEGYVLAPKLVGSSVGLHPVWLMFALFAFGYLFGFVGMLLAVPLAAAMGVIARFALARYLESPFYRGPTQAPEPVAGLELRRQRDAL